jgi:hypothetical protein
VRTKIERFLVAPGEAAMEKLDTKSFEKLRKAAEKRIEKGTDKLSDAAEDVGGKSLAKQLRKLPHYWNIGVWATGGFFFCFAGTILFGISSIESAVALGFKVTLFMIFFQGLLVFGGFLAYKRLVALTGLRLPGA